MAEFKKLFTNIGLEKQAGALYSGEDFEVASIVIGDGAGSMYDPTPEQTTLVNPRDVLNITEHLSDGNVHKFFAVIPSTIENYTIREIGLIDSDNNLLWVSQFEMQTVSNIENIVAENIIGVQITVTDGTTVVLVDGNIQMASKEYVNELVEDVKTNFQKLSEKSQPNGYAPLDEKALIPREHLPKAFTNCVIDGNTDSYKRLDLIDAKTSEETSLEYKTAGTYNFTVSVAGNYHIELVGGGAGGWFGTNSGGWVAVGGGSAAAVVGSVYLDTGTYQVTVGAGGKGGKSTTNTGGKTVIRKNGSALITCNGGYAEHPGTVTIASGVTYTATVNRSGNSGSSYIYTYASGQGVGSPAGGASVYSGYGAGGSGYYGGGNNGATGYFKAVISSASSEVVEYKVSYDNPLVLVTADNEKQTIDGINADNITSLADGTYHKFVNAEGDELLQNNVYYQLKEPVNPVLNDVWVKIGESVTSFKYDGTDWQKYNKVLIGTLVIESGQLTDFENVDLYENNFNLTTFNSSTIAHYAMPGDRYIDLTLGASGTQYRAPATGFFSLYGDCGHADGFLHIYRNGRILSDSKASSSSSYVGAWMLCRQGDIATIYYNYSPFTNSDNNFRFIYAEGETY